MILSSPVGSGGLLEATLFGNFCPSTPLHPVIDLLGVVHDFRDRAVEPEEAIGNTNGVAGVRERTQAAHQIGAAAADNDVKRRGSIRAKVFTQCVTHGPERLIDMGTSKNSCFRAARCDVWARSAFRGF